MMNQYKHYYFTYLSSLIIALFVKIISFIIEFDDILVIALTKLFFSQIYLILSISRLL